MVQDFLRGFVLIGKVTRPHGSRGMLRIFSYADSKSTFLKAGRVWLKLIDGTLQELKVEAITPHKNIYLLQLDGVHTRNEAEVYRNSGIYIPKETLTREDDEFFWYELMGIDVYMESGEYIGKISHILETPGNDVYSVKNGTNEILIPATHEVIKEINLPEKRMTIFPMEGLLDLNAV